MKDDRLEDITDSEMMALFSRIMKTQRLRFQVRHVSPGGWGEYE